MFGPTTTTRHVYDVAAQHVISGAMEGVNGNLLISMWFDHTCVSRHKLSIGKQFTIIPLTDIMVGLFS